MESTFSTTLIAPCGIDCNLCLAYLRNKNRCEGCWGNNESKPHHCSKCSIKNCVLLAETTSKFCYDCPKYQCTRLRQLDKRYRLKYNVSIVENLMNIKKAGKKAFIEMEEERWTCKNCGGTICVHRGCCLKCNGNVC